MRSFTSLSIVSIAFDATEMRRIKQALYKYHLYCAGAAFAVPKYSDLTSMNIVCMLALHSQCQNFLHFRYMNIACIHVGAAFAVPKFLDI